MAAPDDAWMGGQVVDMQEVIASLEKDFGPHPGKAVSEAVRIGDRSAVLEQSRHLTGSPTLLPKKTAILEGRLDFLKLLLEQDDLIDEELVFTACERKDREGIRMLLDFGWPIDRPVRSAASLLCTAVDDLDFMKWLIANGADVNARSQFDESVFSMAITIGSIDVVHFLFTQATDWTRGDLLHCAAQRGNQDEGAELVDRLVERGADVNAHRYNNPVAFRWRGMFKNPTPLHIACMGKNIPVVRALLRNGADPHMKMLQAGSLTPPTCFESAIESKNRELIDLLAAAPFLFT